MYLNQPFVCFFVGSVGVYVVVQHANKIEMMYRSTAKTGKHTDPVWQVTSYLEHQQNLTPTSFCALF